MIFKMFDVAMGSCLLLFSPTGKIEMVDFGCSTDWSPVDHVYRSLLGKDNRLHRMVLTHHHGDHLNDLPNLGSRRPDMIVRRPFTGVYKEAAKKSNSDEGQKLAEGFADIFDSWTGTPTEDEVSESAWGMKCDLFALTVEQASSISSTDGSLVNNCSYTRLYTAPFAKIFLPGDMEKEGLSSLLKNSVLSAAVSGVNILVAPHHGHRSGFSSELFDAMGKPDVVLSSTMAGDEYVDSRYSSSDFVKGIDDGKGGKVRLMTTRTYGAMTVRFNLSGSYQIDCHTR